MIWQFWRKRFQLQAFFFEPFYLFFEKSFIFLVKIVFEVDKKTKKCYN